MTYSNSSAFKFQGWPAYDISAHLNLSTGGTIELAEAVPYKDPTDNWRVTLNIMLNGTSSVMNHDFSIDGIKWGGASFQAGTASGDATGGYAQTSTSGVDPAVIALRYPLARTTPRMAGDFKLDGKPTWAV